MTPTVQITLDTASALTLSFIFVGLLKAFLEKLIPPISSLHDSAIQLMAIAFGVGFSLLFIAITGPVTSNAALNAFVAVVFGVVGGSGAVGAFHISTAKGKAFATPIELVPHFIRASGATISSQPPVTYNSGATTTTVTPVDPTGTTP